MGRPLILLLAGWAHSGKDTVAKVLVETYDFQKYAFADPVKQKVARDEEIPLEWCYDQKKKAEVLPSNPERTLRDELIRVGEEARELDKEVWAKVIGEKLQKAIHRGKTKFVISDWRMLPELWTLQKLLPEAVIVPIRIERPSQIVSPVPDATEYSLLGFPFWRTIVNSGTIIKLLGTITELVEQDIPTIWKEEEE
jgi:dephospho-CoA kinase